MDSVATMNLSTWQGMRSRDPRRLALDVMASGDRIPDPIELDAILARARKAGVASIETARAWPESELRIGHATAPEPDWRIITRLDPDVHQPGLDIAETHDRVSKSLEASRGALDTERLSVLLLHRFGHRHACGGRLWRRLLAERDAGRIGALGICAATPEEAWAALEDPDIEILQVASSLLDLRLHRQGFFPRARELGRTVYVRDIFLQGVARLEPESLPPALRELVAPLRTIRARASRIGVTTAALFLAFARALPGAHPILRCDSDAELEALLADWASDAIDVAKMTLLVDALPTLDAAAVDPTRWLSAVLDGLDAANQTGAASIATMPA